MELFDDVLRGKNPLIGGTVTLVDSKKDEMTSTNRNEEVEAFHSNKASPNTNKMNPPPNLLKKNPSVQSTKVNDASPPQGIQHKTSNISIGGSFTINDNLSMIIGSNNNNPFVHSR